VFGFLKRLFRFGKRAEPEPEPVPEVAAEAPPEEKTEAAAPAAAAAVEEPKLDPTKIVVDDATPEDEKFDATSAAIAKARAAAEKSAKGSIAHGGGKVPEPTRKTVDLTADEEAAIAAAAAERLRTRKFRLQILLQGASAFLVLSILGGGTGYLTTLEPPEPPAGHVVEFDMPVLGAGWVGQQGAPGVPKPAEVTLLATIDPDLTEDHPLGPLPRIADDGRKAWRHYARPFQNPESKPRIAVVIGRLGLHHANTEAAIQKLPQEVTLAFSTAAKDLDRWVENARAAGHEAIVELPLEPTEFPRVDPSPHTLLSRLPADDNMLRLNWVLSRFGAHIGVLPVGADLFLGQPKDAQFVMEALKSRGLMMLDTRPTGDNRAFLQARQVGLPVAVVDLMIDRTPSRAEIDRALAALEALARKDGFALGFAATPLPVTIAAVAAWAETLEDKGILLAPASAMVMAPRES